MNEIFKKLIPKIKELSDTQGGLTKVAAIMADFTVENAVEMATSLHAASNGRFDANRDDLLCVILVEHFLVLVANASELHEQGKCEEEKQFANQAGIRLRIIYALLKTNFDTNEVN